MLGLELNQFIVLSIGVLMVFAGLYGLVPLASRAKSSANSIRIREKDLAKTTPAQSSSKQPVAEGQPVADEQPVAEEAGNIHIGLGELMGPEGDLSADLGLVEELFAELFMLRATLAELTTEVHALRDESSERQNKSRASLRQNFASRRLRSVA